MIPGDVTDLSEVDPAKMQESMLELAQIFAPKEGELAFGALVKDLECQHPQKMEDMTMMMQALVSGDIDVAMHPRQKQMEREVECVVKKTQLMGLTELDGAVAKATVDGNISAANQNQMVQEQI